MVVAGGPAAADERVVQISRDGVQPQLLQVEPGDTVRFVNEDPTFAYRAQSTGGPWAFDSGPTALLEGDFVVPAALTRPGSYGYRVAQDAPFAGTVVVAGAVPAATPTAAPSPLQPPPPSPAPGPAVSASPSAAAVAGPAVAGPLPGLRRERGARARRDRRRRAAGRRGVAAAAPAAEPARGSARPVGPRCQGLRRSGRGRPRW